MKFIATISTFAAAIALTAAAPTPEAKGNPHKPSDYKHYYVQSKIINNSGPSDLDGLYVYPYHTGAGLNDACLSKKPSFGGFLNGTRFIFDLSTEEAGSQFVPYGTDLILETEYTSFQPVEINAGYGSHGFYVKDGTLQSHFQKEFGGWRVCNWWHDNVPQLFHTYNFVKDNKISSNCADVDLVLVPVKSS